jgi:hypothetical protein
LAKALIEFNATKAIAGSASATGATGVARAAALSGFINAYLTDVTELTSSEVDVVNRFLAAVGAPTT